MSELELKFSEKLCAICPTYDCLVRCQYMDIDKDTAKVEMQKMIKGEDSFVLHECATCYACEEYCKRGNHPFFLITDLQEKRTVFPVPRPLVKQWVNAFIPGRRDIQQFWGAEEPVISLCVFPEYVNSIEGKLFENVSVIMGRHVCCQPGYVHFGNPSIIRKRLPRMIENIAGHDFKEVIFFHDECYSAFTSYAPAYGIKVPFKSIHFFDYLFNRLKEHESEIEPLNVKVAYQRPCTSRLTPRKEHFVDDIFNLIGVERVERIFDRENCLCCAGTIRGQQRYDLFVDVQKRNVEDVLKAEAEYCVFNCPACFSSLSEAVSKKGIRPIMMHDLCKLALGEKPAG